MQFMEDFIRNFIRPSNRDRYLELISRKKGVEKFRRLLDHDIIEDLEGAELIPKSKQNVEDIERLLVDLKVENTCVAISTNPEINEKHLIIREALEETVGYGFGTILIFPKAGIGYYESEERNHRYIFRSR